MHLKHLLIGNLPGVRQGMQNRKVHSTKIRLPAYRQAGIHFNPCKGNKLIELPEQYEHSSAKYYFTGEQGIYPVTYFMELQDIDLTRLRI